jgi:hypothetical protein
MWTGGVGLLATGASILRLTEGDDGDVKQQHTFLSLVVMTIDSSTLHIYNQS